MPQEEPFALNGAVTFELTSNENKKTYKIFVSAPKSPPPSEGWPVVYTSDGNAMFPQIAATANLLRMNDRAVFVGIGYPSDAPINTERRYYDLTPKTPVEVLQTSGRADPNAETGGNDQFLHFIESELKPLIEKRWQIDRSRQSLFGHSLGGLFVLHALFENPEGFQNYLAAAPSVWWNDNSILQELNEFKASPKWGKSSYRLIVLNNIDSARSRSTTPAPEDHLSNLITTLQSDPNAQIQHRVFEDESHITMVAPSVTAALRFALGDTPRNNR